MSQSPTSSHLSHRILWGVVIVLALTLGAVLLRQPGLITGGDNLARAEMDEAVHEYILDNPEIVELAIRELQRRQMAAEEQEAKAQIAQLQDPIFRDGSSHVTNDAASAVNVVQFFDYNCTYCRQSADAVKALRENGDVRFVFKEFPILGPGSVAASRAAIASLKQGGDRYLAFHDAMMAYPGRIEADVVMEIAADVGLDVEQLTADIDDPAIDDIIDRNRALAQRIGVTGTPAYVIEDELVPGAAELSYLESLVKEKKGS